MTHTERPIIGESGPMTELSRCIRKAARGPWTVLIQGESGTGKGLVAREIHGLGERSRRPFISVNCGAIPDNLIESELFGYESGAFTGAVRQKKGKFEAAHGGTFFLDEIGELSLSGQTRLLHVLQDKEVERLGSEGHRIPVDVRVIAATNRDLERMVAEGTFRQDLFFRLNVIPIRMPALRERADDIPALAHHFARRAAAGAGRAVVGISPEVLVEFRNYSWPGNVRELENAMERAVAMGDTEEVLLQDLPRELRASAGAVVRNFYGALDETARELCAAALKTTGGNCIAAAQLLGLHRNTVYRLIRRHNLTHLLSKGETL